LSSSNRLAIFSFKGIYLQPSTTNEPASHGFVRYKIKLNASLPLGTQIKNRAHIYFDYNSAVSTNQTVNTLGSSTGLADNFETVASLYPNPTNGLLYIHSNVSIKNIFVLNALGQQMMEYTNVNQQDKELNLNSLPKGIYFVRLETARGFMIKKVVKE
jgi:hypothetical protein